MDLTRNAVLLPRVYNSSVTPPATLEDRSRWKNNSSTFNSIVQSRLPSGQWIWNFDGTNSYIECPDAPTLLTRAGCKFTCIAWLNTATFSSDTNNRRIFDKNQQRSFYLGAGRALNLRCRKAATNTDISSNLLLRAVSFPSFVAVTYDNANVNFMINGVMDTPQAFASPLDAVAGTFNIGSTNLHNAGRFLGWLSIRLFSYAFTPSNLYAIFQSERRNFNA